MQPKQSDDEDFGMAPMKVDSSSSDNFSRAEVRKQAKVKTAKLRLRAEHEVETYSDEVTEDEQIYLGDSALLR
eukprot:7007469-Pyramimonas_sp.AAC.1